jgi:hypothetical protein
MTGHEGADLCCCTPPLSSVYILLSSTLSKSRRARRTGYDPRVQ